MPTPNTKKTDLAGIAFRALGTLSMGIVITRADTVVYCNEAFASMTALDQNTIIGMKHPFLGPPFVSDTTVKSLSSYLENPSRSTSKRIEYTRADGVPAWNEIQLCRENSYTTWMHRDITQQMGTHELWQRYEFLLDTSQQYMALINRGHAYELVNRSFAAAFDTTPEEINGSGAATVWGNAMFSTVVAPYLERCFEGEQVQVMHWVDLPVGGHRCLDMIYTPYRDKARAVIHVVFVAWDVTREKRATDAVHDVNRQLEQRVEEGTAELQDTMQELEAFNYTIAHDLRSPLRFLKSFARMLDDKLTGLDEAGRA
ncbi:MAG: PAS domain-containing protein, partial [Candidatus Hydrogenedentes bacterium]|nr:PAS domain-containing protein [Candidatus Hydrogenedentota bacterium]